MVSEDVMQQRLQEIAQKYPDAIIERLALSDAAFPADPEEAVRLNGYTVVLVTSTTQNPEELPPARVYTWCEDEQVDLSLIMWRESVIEASWGQTVGPHRYDGFYLIPVQTMGRPECKLAMDYAKNRVGQVITGFEAGIPQDVVVMAPIAPPTEEALWTIIAREYPFVMAE